MRPTFAEIRETTSDGSLPAYAWPGGYQMVYYTQDGGTLCPDCANGKNGSCVGEADVQGDPQWTLTGWDVFYEGPPQSCDHCGTLIESAYGDPDSESE